MPGATDPNIIVDAFCRASGRTDREVIQVEMVKAGEMLDRRWCTIRLASAAEIVRRFRQVFWRETHRTIDDLMRWSGAPAEMRDEIARIF